MAAYDLGLKGCTTYRPNAVTGAVLSRSAASPAASAATTSAVAAGSDLKEPGKAPAQSGAAGLPRRPAEAAAGAAGIIRMAEPLERETVLGGFTYKLRWPGSDDAIYITINDIERDGRRRPFEVFINTKNLEHYAWTVALTRMISAIFRRGGDVTFVVEELKAIFDPQGGQWMGGRYVPSLIAAIGEVIEGHMIRIGFLPGAARDDAGAKEVALSGGGAPPPPVEAEPRPVAGGRICPRCNSRSLHRREGCWICDACGYSKCG
jgi:ribonucleoside-diphosphate reductase alpha chain